MAKTYGLTHIALGVRDVERSLHFYEQVFGMEAYFREPNRIHARTPGSHDVITFDQSAARGGDTGDVIHFGFRLQAPGDMAAALEAVKRAGGHVLQQGEFASGYPFAYVADPDGYEVEIWYE